MNPVFAKLLGVFLFTAGVILLRMSFREDVPEWTISPFLYGTSAAKPTAKFLMIWNGVLLCAVELVMFYGYGSH